MIVPPNVFLHMNYAFNRNSIVTDESLFEETGYFRIYHETSYRNRSSLAIHKLETTCLESNKAKKLFFNELVATKP